jgi:pyruvate formate lyase activating enzyme
MSPHDLNRRAFLSAVGRCAGGAGLACGLAGPLVRQACAKGPAKLTRQVDFYEQLPGRKIQCFVCPLHCTLSDGETCFCRTRTNVGGKLFTKAYNNPCVLGVDPIEKLPLNHFRPGTKTLTIGTGGCNLRCLYCQNWQQSQKQPDRIKTFRLTPADAVAAARKKNIDTIAFSYTEPVAFLEYAKDIAVAAKKARMKVVVATAGFIDPKPLLDFARYVDAFAVSLKGFDQEFYFHALGVKREKWESVLTAIETLKNETKCWIELVNLVVPTYNDQPQTLRRMCEWVHEHLGDDVPLHFARFVPTYKLTNLPRTPVPTLESALEMANRTGLRYAYTSNVAPHDGTNTFCANCGSPVIQRLGFKVLETPPKKGTCPKCRHRIPGVWS